MDPPWTSDALLNVKLDLNMTVLRPLMYMAPPDWFAYEKDSKDSLILVLSPFTYITPPSDSALLRLNVDFSTSVACPLMYNAPPYSA